MFTYINLNAYSSCNMKHNHFHMKIIFVISITRFGFCLIIRDEFKFCFFFCSNASQISANEADGCIDNTVTVLSYKVKYNFNKENAIQQ